MRLSKTAKFLRELNSVLRDPKFLLGFFIGAYTTVLYINVNEWFSHGLLIGFTRLFFYNVLGIPSLIVIYWVFRKIYREGE